LNTTASGRRTSSQLSQARAAQVAAEIIAEEGIEALSMRVLATRLGCSVGTLTYHFKSKQDLLDQVFTQYSVGEESFFDNLRYGEKWVDDVMERVEQLLPLSSDWDTQWRVHLAYWAYSLPSGPGAKSRVHDTINVSYAVSARLFRKAQQAGNVSRDYAAESLAMQFTHMITGTIFTMLHTPVEKRGPLVAPIREFLQRLA